MGSPLTTSFTTSFFDVVDVATRARRLFPFFGWLPLMASVLVTGCATSEPTPSSSTSATMDDDVQVLQNGGAIRRSKNTRPITTAPVDARTIYTRRAPLLHHDACKTDVFLRQASPVHFEDAAVANLRQVAFDVAGPPGLRLTVSEHSGVIPNWDAVQLPPVVALQLPAGPAVDAAAGSSGAFYDFAGLAVVGMANLLLLPVSLPLGLLTNNPDAFFFDAPAHRDGMFADVVLDQAHFDLEVQRRAQPHTVALATEAERQGRFDAWRSGLLLDQQVRQCVVGADGHCELMLLWPTGRVAVDFDGLPCAAPPPPPPTSATPATPATTTTTATTSSASTGVDSKKGGDHAGEAGLAPAPTHTTLTGFLPSLATPPRPRQLPVPPRPDDDTRGDGAVITQGVWQRTNGVVLTAIEARKALPSSGRRRGKTGVSLDDGTIVCRLRAHGKFDVDGSPPELRTRLAWGYDRDVVGATFATVSTRDLVVGVRHATVLPGELVKLSVVDIDSFVDDWVGMAVGEFTGTWPLQLDHPRFTATCHGVEATSGT